MSAPAVPVIGESLAMHERRPQWLVDHIAKAFSMNSALDVDDYCFHGDRGDYQFADLSKGEVTWASHLVLDMEDKHQKALRILDIGTGIGSFVDKFLKRGHDAIGLTAHDYRQLSRFANSNSLLPDSAYIVGDANNLAEIPALEGDFDFIISRFAVQHMIDPMSVLEQAVNKLRPGGSLVFDVVKSKPIYARYSQEVTLTDIASALQSSGLEMGGGEWITKTDQYPYMKNLTLHKPAETPILRLPVFYVGETSKAA